MSGFAPDSGLLGPGAGLFGQLGVLCYWLLGFACNNSGDLPTSVPVDVTDPGPLLADPCTSKTLEVISFSVDINGLDCERI